MGKSAPAAPAAPDPAQTAAAQGAVNLETAIAQGYLNNPNLITPYGNVTSTQSGTVKVGDKDVPQFTQTTTLSPSQQRQLDLTNALQEQALGLGQGVLGNVGNAINKPFSLDGLPQAPGVNDFTSDRDLVTNSLLERNQPQMDRARESLSAQLYNQGIMPGSEAYRNAMDDIARQENDFRLGAIQAGSAEQSRLFGLGTQARQQAIQEQSLLRSQPINEYATLLGLGGNVQSPQFGYSPGQVAQTDVVGPMNTAYSGQLAQYNANNAANNATRGGLFGLAGALGSAAILSDAAVKTDIVFKGMENGLPVYHFRYKNDPSKAVYRGVMAQDVEKIAPEAVIDLGEFKAVNYGMIGIEFARVH